MLGQRVMFWIAAAVAVVVSGCSRNSGLVPVSGKVTYQGQPVPGATVLFMGDANSRPATAISGPDGSYSLRTLDSKGALPGQYTAVVSKTELSSDPGEPPSMEEAAKAANRPPPPPKKLLPAKYADAAKSPLKFEVKKGQTNSFDLQLAD
jgi:cell division septation protein DedD